MECSGYKVSVTQPKRWDGKFMTLLEVCLDVAKLVSVAFFTFVVCFFNGRLWSSSCMALDLSD